MNRLWRDHSLPIVLCGAGLLVLALSLPIGEGRWFDTLNAIGGGLFGAGAVFALQSKFRERHRPEDDPKEEA